jgi:hypothetical protein
MIESMNGGGFSSQSDVEAYKFLEELLEFTTMEFFQP